MVNRVKHRNGQPPKPRKGASSAEIKAWVAACCSRMTPEDASEYEATGENLKAIFERIGFDPKADGGFAPKASARI